MIDLGQEELLEKLQMKKQMLLKKMQFVIKKTGRNTLSQSFNCEKNFNSLSFMFILVRYW